MVSEVAMWEAKDDCITAGRAGRTGAAGRVRRRRFELLIPTGAVPPFVIPTGAKRSGGVCGSCLIAEVALAGGVERRIPRPQYLLSSWARSLRRPSRRTPIATRMHSLLSADH